MENKLVRVFCFLAGVISIHGQTLYGVTTNGGVGGIWSLIQPGDVSMHSEANYIFLAKQHFLLVK